MSPIDISKRNSQERQKPNDYPAVESHFEKILVVVKATPNPSDKYRETVCTAGVTESGKWIRLYPVPFRYMAYQSRFSKYQWVNFKIKKRSAEKDFRIDSYEPEIAEIHPIGQPLPARNWIERKKIILPTISPSLHHLEEDYKNHSVSLGIFKPKRINDFIITTGKETWSKRHEQVLTQGRLFEEQPKPLEKIPFTFSYDFTCNDSRCNGHRMQIIDWEIEELYRNMKQQNPYAIDAALEKVKNKWLTEMWAETRDSYLIVGTIYPNPTYNVLGVFWPPR